MTGVYCVFCRTGFEAGIESRLKRRGYATLVPKIKKFKPSGGKLVEKELCLLPGYVFFETDETALDVRSINTLQNAIKLLQYDDGEYRLRGADLDFVEWIRRHDRADKGNKGRNKDTLCGRPAVRTEWARA